MTDLSPLRDSNPLYSTTWRLTLGWWLKSANQGRFGNPLDANGPPLSFGALSRVAHFKANHRKLALTGDGKNSLVGIVSSAIRMTPAARIPTSRCGSRARRCVAAGQ
jgi:hypothetical protein